MVLDQTLAAPGIYAYDFSLLSSLRGLARGRIKIPICLFHMKVKLLKNHIP
jgi:hypothetical protein